MMRRPIAPAGRSWKVWLALILSAFVLSACAPAPSPTPVPTRTAVPQPAATSTAVPLPTSTETTAPPAAVAAAIPALDADRMPVFITTDMSSDDPVAILYLLSHPEVQVLGIGSADGVAHVEPGARNVLRLLAVVGQEDIPVAVGRAESLEGDHSFPGLWRSGADRPYGSFIPEAKADLVEESTAELLAKVVNTYPGEVTIVPLGAHTDLALALRDDPDLAGRAVHVPGNIHAEYSVIANETAEWNLWVDYVATAEVFSAGIPIEMVPLDATNQVQVDRAYFNEFESKAESAAAKAVAQLWTSSFNFSSQFYIWDVVAAVAMMSPDIAGWESLAIEVVTDEPNNLGQTRPRADQPPNAEVCVSVDVARLQEDLIRVLNH